ncbi:uncharacterized protein LOC143466012 isoform X2 [Clavelina lepadiformis]|uniref:uncharacterized protein LOC143466012 isoform X2 n=1 Tax=Clavelina lepadiformis TaxID=159417 RepID=UPI0040435BF9
MSDNISCEKIVVEVQSGENEVNPIAAGVGGTLAAILGVVLGIFVTKRFLLDIIKKRFNIHTPKQQTSEDSALDPIRENHTRWDIEHSSSYGDGIEKRSEKKSLKQKGNEPDEETKETKHKDLQTLKHSGLANVLVFNTLELMVNELCLQKSNEFNDITKQSWKNRHTCIWMIFRLILLQQIKSKQISKRDMPVILSRAEKNLSESLKTFKVREKDDEKEDLLHGIDQQSTYSEGNENFYKIDANTFFKSHLTECVEMLVQCYRETCKNFEDDVCECVGVGKLTTIHEILVKTMHHIERKTYALQKIRTQTVTDTFHRNLIICQAFHGGKQALHELTRARYKYSGMMLRRLLESDYITEDQGETLRDDIKTKLKENYDVVLEEMQLDMKKMQSQLNQQRNQTLARLNMTEKRSLQKLLDADMQVQQFVQNYFALLVETEQNQIAALKDLNSNEAAEMAQLQKKAKSTLKIEFAETMEKICNDLVDNDTLSSRESNILLNQLDNKIKNSDEEIAFINGIQYQIIERESKSCRSFQYLKADDNDLDSISRSHILEGEVNDLKQFLFAQVYLTEKSCQEILNEYEVFKLSLSNSIDMTRIHMYNDLDADLLKKQIELIAEYRDDDKLQTSGDAEFLWEKLSDIGSEHDAKFSDLYDFASCRIDTEIAQTRRNIASDIAAGILVASLSKETKNFNKEKQCLKAIKMEFLQKLGKNPSNKYGAALNELANEHRMAIEAIEMQLRKEHNIQCQVLEDRMNAKQQLQLQQMQEVQEEMRAKFSKRSDMSMGNVLDRLLEQSRNERKYNETQNAGDIATATQIYIQRLLFQEKLQAELQDLDKNLLCKIASLMQMKKGDMLECVKNGLELAECSESEKKQIVADFSRRWGKLRGTTAKPVKQRRKITQLDEEDESHISRPHTTPSKLSTTIGRRRLTPLDEDNPHDIARPYSASSKLPTVSGRSGKKKFLAPLDRGDIRTFS